jgi:L-threonylcarbamoyladenylate synthase
MRGDGDEGVVTAGAAPVLGPLDARRLQHCVAAGGVAVFPADTVYGLCCAPESAAAVARLYELKGRPPERPAAVMFFTLATALTVLPELSERERAALGELLPGPVTVLLPNRAQRFPLACGPDPHTLGLRVPLLGQRLRALAEVTQPVMQSSANLTGGPEARRLTEVPPALREGADLVLDAGELPGVASTVLDLRHYEERHDWQVVREGPLSRADLSRALDLT